MPKEFLTDAEMAALESQGHATRPQKSQLESGVRGVAQGASLGYADELTGAGEAGLDKLRGSDEALADLYKRHRDESRAEYAQAQQDNPLTYGASEIAGGVGSALATGGVGAGVKGAAALGALSGLGYSSADNLPGMAVDTGKGLAIGGTLGLAGKALSGARRGLTSLAENRANAAFGTEGIGRELLDSGAVNPLASQKSVVKSLENASMPIRAEKNAMLSSDPTAYDLDNIAAKVQLKLGLPQSDQQAASLGKVVNEVDSMASRVRGPVDATHLDKNRELLGLQSKFAKERFGVPGDEIASKGFRDAYGVVKNELEQNNPGLSQVNSKLSSLMQASENVDQSKFGLKDLLSKSGMANIALNKGNQSVAMTADMVAKVLPSNPQAFGRYAQVLDNAMRKSPESLKATIHVLQQSDPEFRKLTSQEN